MSGITIKEFGLGFVKACMETYWGSCLFLLLFAAGLLWTVFSRKKKASVVFLGYTVFLVLTVYNPFLVKYVIPKLDFENEYYRFFWMLPVLPAVAYYGVRLVYLFKKKWQRALAALLVMGIIVSTGTPIEGIVRDFAFAENLYKVPNELRAICDVIHQDSEKEQPRVVFDSSLNSIVRQYDPSIALVLHRNAIIFRSGSTVAGTYDEKDKWYRRQKAIMDVVLYQSQENLKLFQKALYMTKTDYLVVLAELGNHDFIRSAGCETVAVTGKYVIYRFNREIMKNM